MVFYGNGFTKWDLCEWVLLAHLGTGLSHDKSKGGKSFSCDSFFVSLIIFTIPPFPLLSLEPSTELFASPPCPCLLFLRLIFLTLHGCLSLRPSNCKYVALGLIHTSIWGWSLTLQYIYRERPQPDKLMLLLLLKLKSIYTTGHRALILQGCVQVPVQTPSLRLYLHDYETRVHIGSTLLDLRCF